MSSIERRDTVVFPLSSSSGLGRRATPKSVPYLFCSLLLVAVTLISAFVPVHAVNPDTCVQDGGTAKCTAPVISQWVYLTGSYPLEVSYTLGTEPAAVAAVRARAFSVLNACTANSENPAWLGLPAGASSGSRNVGNPQAAQQPTGDYWSQNWTIGTEWKQEKWTHRIKGKKSTTATPACATDYWNNVGMTRQRSVLCPTGWQANNYTTPFSQYCWRAPVNYEPLKNVGPCRDCELQVGNPINVATGNKYQEERDYSGGGNFPLQYVRRYNSLVFTSSPTPSTGPEFFLNSPNWRGSYDRALLYTEHERFATARAYRQDGSVLDFRFVSGQWVADADTNESLVRVLDGSGNPTGWTLTTAADETETWPGPPE